MQKNLQLDERLSFAKPNAESTMNGTFQWGRKNFNNSSFTQATKSPPKNLLKVDARVYTDVHSRGLAARIVKYHENGTRFNRSISMTNLTGKGNSPLSVKKLEAKPQLRYDKAVKQNVSMTHIAPPDKSLFYGNTLSGLLRSSSVIALPQTDDDLSSENRPIIHPPVTEKELQPTRSVLEVLKEISRKRINNEVLPDTEEVVDTSKKYCGRLVDTSHLSGNDFRLQQLQVQANTSLPPQQTPPTYKRQRESAVDGYVPSHCLSRDALSFPSKSQQAELPASPEQQSKRRHCNYNNDITSSLSSSAKNSSAKRKLCESDDYKRQEKLVRYQADIRFPEISSTLSYNSKLPITPLPKTPQTASKEMPTLVQKSVSAPMPATTAGAVAKLPQNQAAKPKLTLFNRNYETVKDDAAEPSGDPAAALDSNTDDNAYAGINFVKPKKSASNISGNSASNLVMERTRKSKLALMLSGLRGEIYLGEEEEEQRLKKILNDEEVKDVVRQQQTPVVENTSSLKPVTADKPDASEQPSSNAAVIAVVNSMSSTPTTMAQGSKISSPLTGIKLTPIAATTTTTTPAVANQVQTAAVKPTLSFNTLPAATTMPTTLAATVNVTAAQPNFSFGVPVSATTATTSSTTTPSVALAVSSTAPPSFSFGLPLKTTASTTPFALPAPPTNTNAGSGLNFNFNSTTKTLAAATSTSASTATVSNAFSFGSNSNTNTAVSSTTTTTAATTPAFTFGGLATAQPAANNLPAAIQPAPTTAAFNFSAKPTAAAFTFGASSTATTATTTEAPKAFSFAATQKADNPLPSGNFAFGANPNAANPPAAATLPTFGSQQPIEAKNVIASTNAFTFGAKPAIQTATVAPVQPSFGANSTENKSTPTNSFLFGGSTANSSSTNNLFGGNANMGAATATTTGNDATKTSNAFSFSNAASQQKTFLFGAATTTTNAANIDNSKSTNLFGAASGGNNQQSKAFSFANQPTPAAATSSAFNFSNVTQNSNNNNSDAFVFGAGGNNANTNKPAIANSFGAAAAPTENKQSSSGTFAFGQTQPANNNNSGSGIFNFGAAAAAAKNPTSTNSAANQPSTTNATNTFGSLNSSSSGGFVFGANTKTPSPSFSAAATNNAPSGGFVFGAAAQAQNSSTTTQPAAGNLFASPNASTQSSGNLFGAPSNTSTTNIFGSNANAVPTFGSASAIAGGTTTTPTPAANNLFAISATPGGEQRPIRRATRRLAKP